MNDQLARYREQFKRLSGEFTMGQKAVVFLAVVAVVVGALAFSRMGSSSGKVVLYANLAPDTASKVTAELSAQGVSYELTDGGATVMVDSAAAAQARLDLAAKDLPGDSNQGWSIIDSQGMTTSEFRQRIDYQRALEGELSKTIEALEPVESAMVRLVVPRSDVFAADDQKPTASVLVTTRAGETLSAAQVNSIVNLTAGAVPGLSTEDVTVTDASGNLLAAPGMDASAVGADANGGATDAFESRVAAGVKDLLSPVFGAGKVRVQVSASLDFSKRETVSETVQAPNPTVVTSEKTGTETLQGAGTIGTGGVLGPDGLPVTGTGGGDTNYANNTAERNYAVGKVTETLKAAPGSIERMSIAVVVDEAAGAQADLAQVSDLVAAATGVDAQRGDTVQVTRLPFDNTAAEDARQQREEADSAASQQELISLVRTVLTWLVVGVVALLIWRSVRRARRAQLAAIAEDDEDEEDEERPAPPRREPEPEAEPTEEEVEAERLATQTRSSTEVLRQAPPSDLAAVMRNWAQEG